MTRIRAALASAAPDLAPDVLDRLAEAATEAAFRLDWRDRGSGKFGAYFGRLYCGDVFHTGKDEWTVLFRRMEEGGPTVILSRHPLQSAARAALERAVREAIYG